MTKTLIIAVLMECHAAWAQVTFLRKDVPAGDRPLAVVVGDFNGDSRPDLAVNSFAGLSVLMNNGNAAFSPSVTIPSDIHPMFGPAPANYPVAADFNRDGKLDLAGTIETSSPPSPPQPTARLLLGRGDGTFMVRDVGPGMVRAVGDFNGDRTPDLVTLEIDQATRENSVQILLGNGEGYFQHGARVERTSGNINVADFNGDALSDLATSSAQSGLRVWINRGDGGFRQPIDTAEGGLGLVADFNKDQVPDIATGTEILLGKGDGAFQPIRYVPSRKGFPIPFTAADFDGDGHVDMAGWLSNEGGEGNLIALFRGKGDGTLSLPLEYATGWQAVGQAAADLDGDGRPELITSNFRSNSLTLLMPKTPGPSLNRAVSSASGTAIVAPESLATLYTATGATGTQTAAAPYPNHLSGLSLQIRDSAGATHAAPLVFVSPTQINFQVPTGTAIGEATLIMTAGGRSSTAGSMQVDAVAPGLFMVSHANSTPAALGFRVTADGRQTPVSVFNCSGPVVAQFSCGPAPIRLTEEPVYLSLYGTGFRGANVNNVTVSLNGMQLPVEYAGPQGTPGVDQVNVRLLPEAQRPLNFMTVAISGVAANTVLLQLFR